MKPIRFEVLVKFPGGFEILFDAAGVWINKHFLPWEQAEAVRSTLDKYLAVFYDSAAADWDARKL